MHKQQTKNATQPQRSSRSVSHQNFSLIRKLSLSAKIPSSKMSFEHQKKTQSSEENLNKCILFPRSTTRQTGMQMRASLSSVVSLETQKSKKLQTKILAVERLNLIQRYCRGLNKATHSIFSARSSTYYLPRIQIYFLDNR